MASKSVKFALSVAALSPFLLCSFAPANAQTPAAQKPTAQQIQKPAAQMSTQPPKNVNAAKPIHTTTATSQSTTLMSYSPQSAPILRLGSRGKAVRDIQAFLKRQKLYNGAVNGVYEGKTRSAVIAFQKSHNLKADGVVGSKTWSAMIH